MFRVTFCTLLSLFKCPWLRIPPLFLTKLCIYNSNFLMAFYVLLKFSLFLCWIMLLFWECLSSIHSNAVFIGRLTLLHCSIPRLPLFYLLLFVQHLLITLPNLVLLQFAHQHSLLKLCKPLVPKPRHLLFVWDFFMYLIHEFSVGLITIHSPSWCISSHNNFPLLIWIVASPITLLLFPKRGA